MKILQIVICMHSLTLVLLWRAKRLKWEIVSQITSRPKEIPLQQHPTKLLFTTNVRVVRPLKKRLCQRKEAHQWEQENSATEKEIECNLAALTVQRTLVEDLFQTALISSILFLIPRAVLSNQMTVANPSLKKRVSLHVLLRATRGTLQGQLIPWERVQELPTPYRVRVVPPALKTMNQVPRIHQVQRQSQV